MNYSAEEIMQYIEEEDVKFIRLAFCDIFGKQKNISIMPSEIDRAFRYGVGIDASAIAGFGGDVYSDLFLHPDPSTISLLPWRPEQGRVIRMFCDIAYPDGRPFEADTRQLLKKSISEAAAAGFTFSFGSEMEFYLFELDENGDPTKIPHDRARYMDVSPADKGENVRREICLTLERMGIIPEGSHHEEGPGQNEIDFRYSDPLTAADHAITFCNVVDIMAYRHGLCCSFDPKPLPDEPGNGFHINLSVHGPETGKDYLPFAISGIMKHIPEMTLFLNPQKGSYGRLGADKAPRYISWSPENRSQLIRVPAAKDMFRRMELRSPDPTANPYLAFTLMIHAALDGIRNEFPLPAPANLNLYHADVAALAGFDTLPADLAAAREQAKDSAFIREILPEAILADYCER